MCWQQGQKCLGARGSPDDLYEHSEPRDYKAMTLDVVLFWSFFLTCEGASEGCYKETQHTKVLLNRNRRLARVKTRVISGDLPSRERAEIQLVNSTPSFTLESFRPSGQRRNTATWVGQRRLCSRRYVCLDI